MSGRIMSHIKAAWELIRAGDSDAGIERLRRAYARDRSASNVMALGEAYLWLKDYRAARGHFLAAIDQQFIIADCYYGMAGTASWCLRDREKAVLQWREGLKCGYTDAAGGITLPLLLFFASAANPGLVAGEEVRQELDRRLRRHWARNWPAPLGQFVLGRIDHEEAFRGYPRYPQQPEAHLQLARWQINFYVAVLENAKGNKARYRELMRAAAETTVEDFDPKNELYLGKVHYPEFFLARYEARSRAHGKKLHE